MKLNNKILTLVEVCQGDIDPSTPEILNIGRKLADELNDELCAVILGNKIANIADKVASLGPDKVFKVENPLLETFQAKLWVDILEKICKELSPEIFLMSHTRVGMNVAPRLAYRLDTEVTTDCVDVRIDPEKRLLLKTKYVYGGNALATYIHEKWPQMATLRPGTIKTSLSSKRKRGEIISYNLKIEESWLDYKIIKKVKEERVNLEGARVIIAGGRGAGIEGFKMIKELATLLGGEVGASRVPVDKGWVEKSRQIGLTGVKVHPDLYIAVGISGALQHIQGVSGARTIIAINKDPKANIFTVADFGVVEKYEDFLPVFLEKLKEMRGV